MAKNVKTRKTKVKGKTKSWYKVLSPKIFNEQEIGRTLAESAAQLKNRTMTVSLGTLLGDVTKQGINLKLKISSTKETSAFTDIMQLELTRPYLFRMIRRYTSFVYSNDFVETKDKNKVKVKTIIVTSFKSKGQQKKDLRAGLREMIESQVAKYNYDALITAVSANKLQEEMQSRLRKIYPIKSVIIQKVELKS